MSVERRLDALESHLGRGEEDLVAIRVVRVDRLGNERLDRTIYCDPVRRCVVRTERPEQPR